MTRKAGFTLLEIMVVVAILGILGATALQFQSKYRQRTTGSEATVMMKRLLQAEIMYFLANEEFFPRAGESEIRVWQNGDPPSATDKQRVSAALNVEIPVGHLLDFRIYRDPLEPSGSPCTVEITAIPGVDIFPGGKGILGSVDKTGKTTVTLMP